MATRTLDPQTEADRNVIVIEEGEHYAPLPDREEDGKVTAHAVQTILAEPQALYRLWRDVALIPRWQEHVISVTPLEGGVTHWVMGDPEQQDAHTVEFDSEMTEDLPGQKIAWQSLTSEIESTGSVTFAPAASGRGTLVTLIQTTKLPFGNIANKSMTVGKRGPKQTVIENLRHFKQLAEAGEIPSVKGQPHGPRGISGGIKEWLYGENNPTPPGTSDLG